EEWRLVGIDRDCDDHLVCQCQRSPGQVLVATGHRIERTWVDRDACHRLRTKVTATSPQRRVSSPSRTVLGSCSTASSRANGLRRIAARNLGAKSTVKGGSASATSKLPGSSPATNRIASARRTVA